LEKAGAPIGARVTDAEKLDATRDASLMEACRRFADLLVSAYTLHGDLAVYANCTVSVNGSDADAKTARGVLETLGARIGAANAAFLLVMAKCPEAFFESFLSTPGAAPFRFMLSQERKLKARFLPLDVEKALSTMAPDGHSAWWNLYNNITGTVTCHIHKSDGSTEDMGLAAAASLLKRPERDLREAAWRGINAAMEEHRESFASTLNAISGWRHAEAGLRSHTEQVHYLDKALHQSRISRGTLEALMETLRSAREIGRRALRAQARLYGVERLAPWDILAPAPAREGHDAVIPFERGLDIVRRAYATVDPAMGAFVDRMAVARRIEGRVLDGKRPGAYCTEFPGSRNPFVYTTYRGALSELSTLAHELGHAYHCEVMRDIPLVEADYPMTLAETASTFAQTVLGDMLAKEAGDEAALLELAWADAQDAATFLVNIPLRFEFESRFYERRPSGPVSADGLRELMGEAWKEWYGDVLSEYDEYYWASKLHFHMSGVSFYNFPYSFGYLFSLGVYARKDDLGAGFHDAYVGLLRDTGRMEAEEVARRHLGVDLANPDFWQAGVRICEEKVARFERMARIVPV
ncbi:MAG: oligoendopeptidase F, partial [Spirochaetales bacterium]